MTDILAIVRPGLAHVRFDAWSESCLAEALGLGRYAGQFEEQGEFFSLGSWRADVMERNSSSEISLLDNWPQAASLMPVDRGQISPIPMTCYVCITTHPRFTVAHERWFSPRSFLDVKTGSHIRPVQRLPDAAQAFLEHEDLPEGYVSICYNYNDGSLIVLGRRNRIRFWLRVPAGNPDDVTDPTGSEKLARLIPEIEAERSDVVADELGDGLR